MGIESIFACGASGLCERAGEERGSSVPFKVATTCFGVLPEKSGQHDIERRQGSGEVLIRTEECAAEGSKGFDHEVSRKGIGSAATSSMTIKRPCLQIGQAFASGRWTSARMSERMRVQGWQRASSVRHCS